MDVKKTDGYDLNWSELTPVIQDLWWLFRILEFHKGRQFLGHMGDRNCSKSVCKPWNHC